MDCSNCRECRAEDCGTCCWCDKDLAPPQGPVVGRNPCGPSCTKARADALEEAAAFMDRRGEEIAAAGGTLGDTFRRIYAEEAASIRKLK